MRKRDTNSCIQGNYTEKISSQWRKKIQTLSLKHLGNGVSPVKARLMGGGLSIGFAQLYSSHSERNVLSFCGYNLFSLGITCPCLDLAQDCCSKTLSRNRNRELPKSTSADALLPRPLSSPTVALVPQEESLRLVLKRHPRHPLPLAHPPR